MCSNEFVLRQFYEKVATLKEEFNECKEHLEGEQTAIIRTRTKHSQIKMDKSVISWQKFRDMIDFGISPNSILQEFVPPVHRHASIIRFVYYNP
jgi:hypothetical protein